VQVGTSPARAQRSRPDAPSRPAPERGVSFVELRSGDTIAWGDPVDGLAVGIGRIQAFLGRESDLVIAAYLENRGSEDLSDVILSTASFVVQIDDGFYAERDYGGISGPMRPGKRDGPVLIDTERLRAIKKPEADPRIDDAAPCVALSTGPHRVAVHYKLYPIVAGKPRFALAPSKHVEVSVPARSGDNDEAVAALTEMLESGVMRSTEVALRKLGKVPGEKAETAIILSLKHREVGVRSAAARALAGRRSKAAVDALIAALEDGYEWCRRDAAGSLGKCGDSRAVGPLRRRLEDPHMETRYSAVVSLMELGEPFDTAWAVPIIRSREGNAFGNAIWLVRRHAAPEAAATLVGCLDMSNASADNYYNYTLVWQIAACGGPKLKYHHDFDSGGTPGQVETNRKTLSALKAWLAGRPGK
jgi:hypothetical protein